MRWKSRCGRIFASTNAMIFFRSPAWIDLSDFTASITSVETSRTNLLQAGDIVDGIALDKYTFLRDAYLQRRRSQVYDGDPPPLDEEPDDQAPDNKPGDKGSDKPIK